MRQMFDLQHWKQITAALLISESTITDRGIDNAERRKTRKIRIRKKKKAYESNSGDESIESGEDVEYPILPNGGLVHRVPPANGVLEQKSERRRSAQHIRRRRLVPPPWGVEGSPES